MTNLGYVPEEAIAAIATPLVPSAIGIIRTSGKNCIKICATLFSRPNALLEAKGNSLVYGWILNPASREKIDEVMLGVYRAPKSFTGEDMVEIFCHGGIAVVKKIQGLLLQNGFRAAERGEFTFRAYINGKTDLTRAEAVKEIIDSRTDSSRGRAAERLTGKLLQEIDSIKKLIIDSIATLEVGIEYPEDEENISDSFDTHLILQAQNRLHTLLDSWRSEKLFQDGAKIVLCGKTNAGKSSLFNAFLKQDRAIVSDIEGTTRDWLESWVDFDGLPVRLFDTAGLRETSDSIEAEGVEAAKDLSFEADIILYVKDSRFDFENADFEFFSEHKNIPCILLLNKSDSDEAKEQNIPLPILDFCKGSVRVSAKSGAGLQDVIQLTNEILCVAEKRDSGVAGLGSERQKKSVQEALERVEHSLFVLNQDFAMDAVVQDLEDSLDSLGEVTGSVTPDDILESIFSHFCVGK